MTSDARHEEWARVSEVETWTCEFPLPAPIIITSGEIVSREYIITRITTESGLQGCAYALTRNAPIAAVLDRVVTPGLVGRSVVMLPRWREELTSRLGLLGTEGLVSRAISLVDICVWDLLAKHAALPLWQMLGGYRERIPALLVDSYPRGDEQPRSVAESLLSRREQGYTAFKLHRSGSPNWMRSVLSEIRNLTPGEVGLVVDGAMCWGSPSAAIDEIASWNPFDLLWAEDPFRGEQIEWISRLRRRVSVPLGAGDEVASDLAMHKLVDSGAVDVVRLDATSQGGLTAAVELAAHARRRGLEASAHVYPEIHQHLAFSTVNIEMLEVFAPATRFDCAEQFLTPESLVQMDNGVAVAPRAAGLGLEFDWDRVEGASR